jgi:putative nucleotidyltransferase with HDIG domain
MDKKKSNKITAKSRILIQSIFLTLAAALILSCLMVLSDYLGTGIFTGEPAKALLSILLLTVIMALPMTVSFLYPLTILPKHFSIKTTVIVLVSVVVGYFACYIFGTFLNFFVVPLIVSGLLVSVLVDRRIGVVTNLVMNVTFLVSYVVISEGTNILMCVAVVLSSMIAGTFLLMFWGRHGSTRLRFVLLGLIATGIAAIVPIFASLLVGERQIDNIVYYGMWSALGVLTAVSLFMLILPLLERAFRVTTVFSVAEFTSLSSPLLRELHDKAPGTYNHSVQVANLAEICATAIGEPPILAKACALYHDIGKIENPDYFIENQHGYNPHDNIIPEISVQMLTQHTANGAEILRRAKFPEYIVNAALEHHGDSAVGYFLSKVKSISGDSDYDGERWHYKNPRPSSRISAIIMICDSVEAAVRSMRKEIHSPEEYYEFISKLIEGKANSGQFDDSELSYKQKNQIIETLVSSMTGINHERIKYKA